MPGDCPSGSEELLEASLASFDVLNLTSIEVTILHRPKNADLISNGAADTGSA